MAKRDVHIQRVSTPELWRLALEFLSKAEVEALMLRGGDRLRRPHYFLRECLLELKMRGTQLELDLRQREKEPAHREVDARVVRRIDRFSGE